MSDETPRNDDGTFTSAEPLVGQAGVEADYGAGIEGLPSYKPMEERPEEEPGELTIREAADLLAASRVPEDPVREVGYQDLTSGERVDPTETVKLERVAKDLSEYHGAQDEERARSVSNDFAKEIDRMRSEALKANPEAAKDLGLSKEEVAAAEAAKAEEATAQEPKETKTVEPTADDSYSNIEGLEESTREALKVPQIRQAVEKEFTKAAETQQAYTTGLQQGQQLMQATVATLAPQLQSIPLEQWPQAIQNLAQVDPVRANLVADTLQKWAVIQQAQQTDQYQRAYIEHHRNEAQSKIEDKRFEQMIGDRGKIAEASKEVLPYFEEIGLNKERAAHLFSTIPELNSAEVKRIIYDAIQLRKIQNAAKPIAQKNLPPVTRPGMSQGRGNDSSAAQIRALEKELSTATSHKAIKIAAKLQSLKRA
jgi:hypothetical protein